MSIFPTKVDFVSYIKKRKSEGQYVYFREIDACSGPTVHVDGKRVVMVGSNDYLGLACDERVREAAVAAMCRWGTGPSGSRFLCGNMGVISELEEAVADLVGKKKALVHTTGFMANSGTFPCLVDQGDLVLCDRESHASIFEGVSRTKGKMYTFRHNDVESARKKIAKFDKENSDKGRVLVTEGVFSMSGSVADLPNLVALKKEYPGLQVFLDDAHGLGVMGKGRGTAAHFGVTGEIDVMMGTFSKAFASVGGFIASDDTDWLEFLKHRSRTLMFSAALPPASAAAALESCRIIAEEPERVERLWANTAKARAGFKECGVPVLEAEGPVIAVMVGDETLACELSLKLLDRGVFVLPAEYPAVAPGKAILRVAFTSAHEDHHIDEVLNIFAEVMGEVSGEFAAVAGYAC
ncbi:pyridoxal phosphate-dependent aminotransferase family protein [uncultured Pseudodesulfovibrio sp.]|uniref:aminotransferase class I/II-fold pyridoxal phosphate-dependent enzyme n=1 Tax=uncultured Pseudodesulfovibrio sp. TaxID=2035858 RepID=UPI0029C69B4E|nr:pyridoxal phosphate-dependent aminotransferase family protein [uncultured Pseudodesulfovibrio sp.]